MEHPPETLVVLHRASNRQDQANAFDGVAGHAIELAEPQRSEPVSAIIDSILEDRDVLVSHYQIYWVTRACLRRE